MSAATCYHWCAKCKRDFSHVVVYLSICAYGGYYLRSCPTCTHLSIADEKVAAFVDALTVYHAQYAQRISGYQQFAGR